MKYVTDISYIMSDSEFDIIILFLIWVETHQHGEPLTLMRGQKRIENLCPSGQKPSSMEKADLPKETRFL